MYSYENLLNKLKEIGLTKSDLTNKLGISSRTIAKIANHILNKIALFLECEPKDLITYVFDNPILQILNEEKNAKISGGLYHELQVRMTYNSNHMEGSKQTEDQTRFIFETRTIECLDTIPIDDIIETSNHFRAIDYVLDIALEPLSEEIIKHIHLLLKQGTKDSTIDWFAVGEYKKRANTVGGNETCNPKDVSLYMKKLINPYLNKEHIYFEDIVQFHAEFEHIHPFQDGNGRVGRLIALKECLKHNIVPFIIEDSKKYFYYRGLSKWNEEKGWLIDTCLDGQDTFKKILSLLHIKY